MSLVPSRLVPVRRYLWSSHGQSLVGVDDRQLLLDAGIEAYLKLDRHFGPALVVPESQAQAARRVLADSPDLFAPHLALPCPRCHAFHPDVRPPYELALVGAGVVAAVAIVITIGSMGLAMAILVPAVVGGAIVSTRIPYFRCHACGHTFDDPRGGSDLIG